VFLIMTLLNRIKCWAGMHDKFYLPYAKPVGLLAHCAGYDLDDYPKKICFRCWKEI